MKQTSLLKIIIAVLLALNLIQVGARFWWHPPGPHHQHFSKPVPELLQLTAEQAKSFHQLAKAHRNTMRGFKQQHSDLAAAYFKQPSDTTLEQIKTLSLEKLKATEKHFDEIQTLLTAEQQANFQIFKKEAIRIIIH